MPRFSGQRLRAARRDAGLSREKVAVGAGVSVSSVERYEQGSVQPGVAVAAALAAVLCLTVDDLIEDPKAERLARGVREAA